MRFALVLWGLVSLLPLSAQVSGRVTGAVVDSTGSAIPGAQVDLFLSGGKKPLLSTTTSADGSYHFLAVRPADYDVSIEAKGFVKATVHGISVDAARETPVAQIKLQLASVSQSVEVSGNLEGVETTNAEVSGTISMDSIKNLPILDRDVLLVLQTKPGVAYNGNSTTVINGLRTSYSDVTLDGINVQDNYLRDNALDFLPNKLVMGQVRQMTLVSSNENAAGGGGATLTAMSTPSGTNEYHGELLWYNRNNYFAANEWFNNQAGIGVPFLNQNQFGGDIGGPIKKDKLFFYSSYEAIRAHQQQAVNQKILTSAARAGIFTYNSGGTVRTMNLLALRGLTAIDPVIQGLLNQVPAPESVNNAAIGDGRNTGGYLFNQRNNEIRDNVTGKIDYNLSTRHALSGSYSWNRDNSDRPDASNGFSLIPKITNPTHANLVALSWRWTPSANLTNEVRGGFNLTYGYFLNQEQKVPYLVTGTLFDDPINEMQTQGRNSNFYTISDDASYQRGRHFIQFGFAVRKIRVENYNADGTVPSYGVLMGDGQTPLSRSSLPGVSTADLVTANALLATLGGYLDTAKQTFNVTSRTSGYVDGAPYRRHLQTGDTAFYVQDKWRILPRLTVTLGLRYMLPDVTNERDSLELAPIVNGSVVSTLLSDATLDFIGKSAGRPWYRRPKKEFAPNIGVAWDPFGNGKTSIRGGYSVHYVNDQELIATENMVGNAGLQGQVSEAGLSGRLSTDLPKLAKPDFQVPRKQSDNYALDPFTTLTTIDPNLHRPYVQEYSIGIQHDFKGTILDARYVGNHVVGAYRALDFNQVDVVHNGFLADFLRAQKNGFLAQARNGVFNPAYNPAIAGSQQLTVFPKLEQGGYLTDENVRFYLTTGEPGELAYFYTYNAVNGGVNFFQNPYAGGADMLTNYSSASYNSLQLEARHRFHSGLSLEGNYTFSKVLSDGDGDVQSRFQAFLDFNNPSLERSRANFDLNHIIKADGYYELPFGNGHRLNNRYLNRVIGGWGVGGTMTWQSGAPFSILSERGTLNREDRSYYNTASTGLTQSQLRDVVKFQMTGNGPMMISQTAINPDDGTGVNIDGEPFFNGQVFYNPTAGTLGGLQRRYFSGPWTFTADMNLKKTIAITEHHHIELAMHAYNVFNHATFWTGDQEINSATFGVIGSTLYAPRRLQFGLLYTF